MPKFPLVGHGVSLITPFTDSGLIDYAALQRIIERACAGRVDFFVTMGPGSEVNSLEPKEVERLVDFTLDVLQGRKPLVLGVSAGSTLATINRLNALLEEGKMRLHSKKGLSSLLVEIPNDTGVSQPGMVAHFQALAEHASLPLALLQRKGPKGSGLSASSIIELSSHPNIIGFVDGRCDFALTGEVIRRKSGNFAVICGDDVSALPLLALGADAALTTIGNAFPKAFSDLIGQAQFGELVAARDTHHTLAPLMRLLENHAVSTRTKTVLKHLGLCTDHVRLPHAPISDHESQLAYRIIAEMNRSVAEV